LFISAGWLLIVITDINLTAADLIILSSAFTAIAILVLFIFMRGRTKEPDSQVIYSMVSVSLKFILELVLVLVWFFIAKKTNLPSVILFFILYLSFTLYSTLHILNTLRSKSLQKKI